MTKVEYPCRSDRPIGVPYALSIGTTINDLACPLCTLLYTVVFFRVKWIITSAAKCSPGTSFWQCKVYAGVRWRGASNESRVIESGDFRFRKRRFRQPHHFS